MNTIKYTFRAVLTVCLLSFALSSQAFLDGLFGSAEEATPKDKTQQIQQFRQEYKLVFIYSSKCGYCHRFAPIFKQFVNEKKLKAEAISADGGKINGFEDATYMSDVTRRFNVNSFPTVLSLKSPTN